MVLVDSVVITLTGQKPDGYPIQKVVSDWFTANSAVIQANMLVPQFQISSWAIVVDITWKGTFEPVRPVNPSDDTKVPATPYTTNNYQTAGSSGDTIGVLINVKNRPYV